MELVEQKKDQLESMLRLQNYLLQCAEIKSQIQDKRKAIDATQYVGSDLGGVLALQRRLSTMEGALSVLEPKLLHLQVGNYGGKYIESMNGKGRHSFEVSTVVFQYKFKSVWICSFFSSCSP